MRWPFPLSLLCWEAPGEASASSLFCGDQGEGLRLLQGREGSSRME